MPSVSGLRDAILSSGGRVVESPQPGDIAINNNHVELVYAVRNGYPFQVGGNTSGSHYSNRKVTVRNCYWNGGFVYYRPAYGKLKKQTITGLKSTKKGTLSVTWKKDKKATGYEVVVARDKKFAKGRKVIRVSSYKTCKKTISGLKKNIVYYVRIRSYKKVGKAKIYGKYSAIKKIKVHK